MEESGRSLQPICIISFDEIVGSRVIDERDEKIKMNENTLPNVLLKHSVAILIGLRNGEQ